MKDHGLNIAVIGSGISGLSAAWLLSRQHNVTLFEKDDRFGGHSHTVNVEDNNQNIPVDTGFIVFNEATYPNLTAFFDHLNVDVTDTDMSFAVSMNNGRIEYSGTDINGLFAQRLNAINPGFWRMLIDVVRFYRASHEWRATLTASTTLRELLSRHSYSRKFIDEHLVPMGAAIWSTPADKMLDYPALAFLRFCENHGLLQLTDRPQWKTVKGGSREYVSKIISQLGSNTFQNRCVRKIKRYPDKVIVSDLQGTEWAFDHVVMACHADTTLQLLSEPDELEQLLLGAFTFQRNTAVLHSDKRFMPQQQRAWASWNYLGTDQKGPSVTYWMNRLQHLDGKDLFVTLNPAMNVDRSLIHGSYLYDHPVFTRAAIEAQQRLWELQGRQRTWFCGAWFGYGFHEDGLQSGLAVAEALGGLKRPWSVEGENNRLVLPESYGASHSKSGSDNRTTSASKTESVV
ncbi:NADH-ubiquinone oxidoreductase subunit 6 [Endozoicomonas montiporae]|uniref:NADH-ubiquinone oxidoreductase subunit 6 n=2 Tax=Endozoicomonas montiporae TaxID=1027273 RepID=A0A081N4L8_9GAMM|nr:FAD-dependent oxidoreductase [Endozoicomonas montiporae]AMO57743.1 amine oxidase [Endozoicomonas montiporae CL-33]KEQ13391.1 NADH-ubiquinone oxidoreductase subunit 6 [Endozoicomonas montiporae]